MVTGDFFKKCVRKKNYAKKRDVLKQKKMKKIIITKSFFSPYKIIYFLNKILENIFNNNITRKKIHAYT